MEKKCKQCGYERQTADTAPDYECPKCGAIYAKVEARLKNDAKDSRLQKEWEKYDRKETLNQEKHEQERENREPEENNKISNSKLINCKECGNTVSKKAETCPSCGAPVKKKPTQYGCGALILLIFILFIFSYIYTSNFTSDSKTSSKPSSTLIKLNTDINFGGEQFVILNKDPFDWKNVELEINSKFLSGGYSLRTPIMKSLEIYTVGAMQFTNSDGKKFNPFTHKVLNISITGDTPKGLGHYYGTWE